MNSPSSPTAHYPTIKPVRGRADLKTFVRLPGMVHRNDPSWVEPLHFERRQHLSPDNPVFEHVDWQGWIAWHGDRPVGRISAQVDRLHHQYHGNGSGHFGMLDAIDQPEVFSALTATAERWLKNRGVTRVTGPFSLTINEESGLLVEGFEHPPVMMMGHAQPYYARHLERLDYRPAKDLLAYWMAASDLAFTEKTKRMMDRVRGRVTLRPIDLDRFDAELMLLRDIFNDAWSRNWEFIPFTRAEFRELGKNLKHLVTPEMILIAELDGEAAGFIIGMPNLNEAIAPLNGRLLPVGWLRLLWRLKVSRPKTGRVPLMGVRRDVQFSRVGPVLALLLIERLRPSFERGGLTALEMSWILEDNAGMRNILERIGANAYKRYRVYQKEL